MAFQGIEELIAAAGPGIKDVEVEFGGVKSTLRIRQLRFREAGVLNAKLLNADGKVETGKIGEYRENLLAQTLVDADGKPAYTADQIGEWPVLLVDVIEAAVRKANGLTDTAAADGVKNS
jgi:hypothetical protein